MFYIDGYADKYQRLNGFEVKVRTPYGDKIGYISINPTTRAGYDLSMRENTVDGLITMDEIEKLKSGYLYSIKEDPSNIYFIQTLSLWEQQLKTKNFNAIRCNCKITVRRKGFEDDMADESWIEVYKDVCASISETLSDSKNFNAGFEVTTIKVIQLPIWEIVKDEETGELTEKVREIKENDSIEVKNLISNDLICYIHVESVDNFGISGTIRLQGTQDMRI